MYNYASCTQEERVAHLHFLLDEYSKHWLYVKMAKEALLTNLAPRIYLCRGCGFHYEMELRLGELIKRFAILHKPSMSHLEKHWDVWSEWMIDCVVFEGLCEDVIRAEN